MRLWSDSEPEIIIQCYSTMTQISVEIFRRWKKQVRDSMFIDGGLYGVSSSRLGEVWPRYTLAGALRILWSFGVTWGHWLAIERPSFTIVVRCIILGDWPERELKERQLQVSVTKWKLVLIWCVCLSLPLICG